MFFTRVFSLGADRMEAKITKRLEYQQEISFELSKIDPAYSTIVTRDKTIQSVLVLGLLILFAIIFVWMMIKFELNTASGGSLFLVYLTMNALSFLTIKKVKFVTFSFRQGGEAFSIGEQGPEKERFEDFVAQVATSIKGK